MEAATSSGAPPPSGGGGGNKKWPDKPAESPAAAVPITGEVCLAMAVAVFKVQDLIAKLARALTQIEPSDRDTEQTIALCATILELALIQTTVVEANLMAVAAEFPPAVGMLPN